MEWINRSGVVRKRLALLVLFGCLLAAATAAGTVVQVDGTVIPVLRTAACNGNLQVCFDNEEGVSPPNAQAIEAILDAATVPEVFLPNTATTVEFKDVVEGAGFENSFGYYNIGDDVSDFSNLHPIFGCGVDAADHSGEAGGYVTSAEAGALTTLDFAAEEAAGRYKGGFIGFYLITPEDNPSDNNCGDFVDGTDGNSLFGRIYYTQRDLNNDGDFIHHLVYNSRQVPDRFYFGFEDLFRGGDNDFDDMLIKVTGLTPPCSPSTEICDGFDNDCDGDIDEDTEQDSMGQPLACTCDDVSLTCQGGAQQGICQNGSLRCVSGAYECAPGSSAQETCNNQDDNCNGVVDDNPSDAVGRCDGSDADLCDEGDVVCVSGNLTCNDNTGDNDELCNDLDDDCDGETDETPVDVGQPCDSPSDTDLCPEGVTVCTDGNLTCNDNTGNDLEVCNAFDDDCDTDTDEDASDVGQMCSVGIGACLRNGATVCNSGNVMCGATAGTPSMELCDGGDNNCNGAIDEGFNLGAGCDGVGECPVGVVECATPTSTRCSTDRGGSTDGSETEICNGLDDDCDGDIDEGLADLGPCGTNAGECSEGRLACVAGAPLCQGGVGPQPELCNMKDDDCNGATDDAPTDEGTPCGSNVGECMQGLNLCDNGVLVCQNDKGPSEELCNALDDDCDGSVDNTPTDLATSCGLTDVGVCELGREVCLTGGIKSCNGAINPTFEVCNGLDDDCDGEDDEEPIDIGTVCGSAMGTCLPGVLECQDGARVCVGATPGVPETCNGIDDDCDNVIDEDPTDAGTICGVDLGVCEKGAEACVAGELQCVGGVLPGTEICNGLDDDCNGDIDDGGLCEDGMCLSGRCSLPCAAISEFFSCPRGQRCEEGFCVEDQCSGVSCPPDADGTGNTCLEGECIALCDTLSCGDPNVCRRTDGACVGNNCNFLPYLCMDDEVCTGGECMLDPCMGVSCEDGEFCRGGDCIASCAEVSCEDNQLCRGGSCQASGCDSLCSAAQFCDAAEGECADNPCIGATPCDQGKVCEPESGDCVLDPCTGVSCPGSAVCTDGECVSPAGASNAGGGSGGGSAGSTGSGSGGDSDGDGERADNSGDNVLATGGGGFQCAVSETREGRPSLGALGLLLAMAALGLRRRHGDGRRLLRLAGLAGVALWLAGCSVDPFCVRNCPGAGDGGPDQSGFGFNTLEDGGAFNANLPDAGDAASCVPADEELCNGVDDDCDEKIDEGFDLTGDLENCGACGLLCSVAGAQTTCDLGQCVILGCFAGFVDLNTDATGMADDSDGCEYECFETNDGVESCDGVDNDCDGEIDEDTDFQNDDNNCGSCGRLCKFFKASGQCDDGLCGFDASMDCEAGFLDKNSVQTDGCEFECTVTNGGVELCDGLDNDCDGPVDEDFDLPNSINDCGRCGRVCDFQHATSSCTEGKCEFDPVNDCEAGWVDNDGDQLNGCELPCVVSNGGVEICDGEDNDCNGLVDDSPTDAWLGGPCNAAPSGTATGICTDTGVNSCVGGGMTCVGAPRPQLELCNGLDDDCDGTPDDAPTDEGVVCQAPAGTCSAGFTVCDNRGALQCERTVPPAAETCNGLDDDCNGTPDDNLTDATLDDVCGTNMGECSTGNITCVNGALICMNEVSGTTETCNNKDDDCDGVVDDNPTDEGLSCGSSVGACVPGSSVCGAGGVLMCSGGVGSNPEQCNNLDDDCNGQVDENIVTDCYTGSAITRNVGICSDGTQTCSAGNPGLCTGDVTPGIETCDNRDEDCDGDTDEDVLLDCYTGAMDTENVGICKGGSQECTAGSPSGACVGEVTPGTEACNGLDEDCDGATDEDAMGEPLSAACYTGDPATRGFGSCMDGVRTCSFGAYGSCIGQVLPSTDYCGDGLDTDCDMDGDMAEGCTSTETDVRLDTQSTAGMHHSFDLDVAYGGTPLGRHVYAVWTDLSAGEPDIFMARSTDGGDSFSSPVNLTSADDDPAVKPRVVAAYNGSDDDRVVVVYQRVNSEDERRLFARRSGDSGANFAGEQTLENTANSDNFKHDLTMGSDGNDVAVVWERLDTATLERTIRAVSSSDAGQNWSAIRLINVNSGAPSNAGKPHLAITGSGQRIFAWREARGVLTTFDIYASYASHADLVAGDPAGGREQRLDGDGMANQRVSDDVQLATAGDNVFVAWNDLSTAVGGGADVVFARSTNAGVSYGAEVVVDDPGMEVSRSYQPVLAVDPASGASNDDRVFLAWPDTREGTQIYFSRSLDSGATFSAPVRASQQSLGPILGTAAVPQIAFGGGDVVGIGYVETTCTAPLPLCTPVSHTHLAVSIDAGANWHYDDPRLDTGSGDTAGPQIAPANGSGLSSGVVALWQDFRNMGGVSGDIYRARAGK